MNSLKKTVPEKIIGDQKLLDIYRLMVLARQFDEAVIDLYASGEIPGFMHLYIGEEAVAVGACAALNQNDYITSTHRGHGHVIAKGGDPRFMMAELLAKKDGYCKGKGGSMHIACLSLGILGANGIVAGGLPISNGAGLTSKYMDTGDVTLCFFGDGATNEGAFHEALNLASVWKLPVIFICENNKYAQTTPRSEHQAVETIAMRALAYGMQGITIDGTDAIEVYNSVLNAVDSARNGEGPMLIECLTYRYRGHWEGDPQPYRKKEEVEEWKQKDCIVKLKNKLVNEGISTEEELASINSDVTNQIVEAVNYARKCEEPKPEEALKDVFTLLPLDIDKRKIKKMDSVSIREALNKTLDYILETDKKAVLFGEDIGLLGGAFSVTKGLFSKYGQNRIMNTPISEGAIIGTAIGSAITGLKPIAEIMFCDFFYVAMDQIVNQMAKMKYMYGGDAELPIIIRTTYGAGFSAAAQHSQSNESMFMHVPGLKILAPSTPDDAVGLLLSAFNDPNPVLIYEHKGLYDETGDVSGEPIPIGKAKIVRDGKDITVVTYGKMRKLCCEAGEILQENGIEIEIIDLRSLAPLDYETIIGSVKKTGRLCIVHEAPLTLGAGAEIAAVISNKAFDHLKSPIIRIAGMDVPIPFSPVLENYVIPDVDKIVTEIKRELN